VRSRRLSQDDLQPYRVSLAWLLSAPRSSAIVGANRRRVTANAGGRRHPGTSPLDTNGVAAGDDDS
jgi:hypothetical protein